MPVIKIIHLNTWYLSHYQKIIDFIKQEAPDILNLQEVATFDLARSGFKNVDYLEKLKKDLQMELVFSPKIKIAENNSNWGLATLSKYPILDFSTQFDMLVDPIVERPLNDPIIQNALGLETTEPPTSFWHYIPNNYLFSTIQIGNQLIRVVNSHFPVSEKCTETLNHLTAAKKLIDILESFKKIPTIFSGDLNIHPESGTIKLLTSYFHHTNLDLKNTLTKSIHRIFDGTNHNHPGYSVDYIFSKGFTKTKIELKTAEVSDHYPLIGYLEI